MQGIRNTIALYFRLVSLVLFFFLYTLGGDKVIAQQNFYDTDLLQSAFFKSRREALFNILPENTMAVFFANPERNRSNDVNFQFSQDPDFYYLTGITQPHSALILSKKKEPSGEEIQSEILFILDRDPSREVWNGRRLGLSEAALVSGIEKVVLNEKFADQISDLGDFNSVLVKFPTDIRESEGKKSELNSMVYALRKKLDRSGVETKTGPLLKLMASLRQIKTPEELVLLQKAINMTTEGLLEAMRTIEPGITEYQAQAIVEFYFKHRGSEYPGYGSISGGGENSCVLHYVTNRKTLVEGDLLLMDMGAEYHGYTADVTRTVPVNGKFSPEQKLIYDLVLEAQMEGIKAARSGNSFYEPNETCIKLITKGLIKLGVLQKDESVRRYFNHGTSHYLGLEVHDPGLFGKLEPGMVITVEPGIYIPEGSPCDPKWWNIGVRIEDDVLITDKEPVVMSGSLPKTTAEIEKVMEEKSIFNSVK